MHNRLKVKEKAEIEFEKKKKYQEKAALFKKGLDLCLKAKANNDYNTEIMRTTWDLCIMNPDVYSVWNMRKEFIMNKKEQYERELEQLNEEKKDESLALTEQFQKLCNDELELTEYALIKNSKSYSAWQHRLWILSLIPKPNFEREFQLNEAYLNKDGRNLHCWHYRTNLCNISGRDIKDEIKFSLDRINDNLSAFSYSTLCYRSLTLTKASNAGLNDLFDWSEEYKMIENGLFTEPNDQALWFYLRWLLLTNFGQCLNLDKQHNDSNLIKIIFNKQIKLLILFFNKIIKVFPLDKIDLIDDQSTISITKDQLKTIQFKSSQIWYVQLDHVNCLKEIHLNQLNNSEIQKLKLQNLEHYQIWQDETTTNQASTLKMRIHDEQLKSLLELKKLEPNNKWLNLILSYFENTDQLQLLDHLIQLDPLRINYYKDQQSKIKLEKQISNLDLNQNYLNLINQQLTVLYTPEPFAHLIEINLTGNQMRCLSTNLNSLISIQKLIIDNNLIDDIQKNFYLPNLQTLSLQNNKLTKHSGICNLINLPKLKIVLLFGNALEDDDLLELNKRSINFSLEQSN